MFGRLGAFAAEVSASPAALLADVIARVVDGAFEPAE